MLKALGVGRHRGGQTRSLNALDELTQIEDAMAAVSYIMSDDVDGAEEHLSKGNSPFHLLGKGVVTFIRATLGFEQEVMREASETLSAAENSAYEHQRRAHRNTSAYQSPIYPPGTEYAVAQAQAQLMSAIVGVLNESLTEAIKSFYKLRKAYLTLESVMEAEKNYLKERSTSSLSTAGSATSSRPASRMSGRSAGPSAEKKTETPVESSTSLDDKMQEKKPAALIDSATSPAKEVKGDDTSKETAAKEDDDDFDFVDADEDHPDIETPNEYLGHLGVPTEDGASIALNTTQRETNIHSSSAPDLPTHSKPSDSVPDIVEDFEDLALAPTLQPTADISLFGTHAVDIFIISGSNFCFGILLLLISLVPPAFSTLLKIVGFKGDKERGMQMLWQATHFDNIHGAMAGTVIFGFYNGMTGFCDIIPQSGEGSYPRERCKALLAEMRAKYPHSHLWLQEEARMLAYDKELEKAIAFSASSPVSPLKQLEALKWFERALTTMYIHDYAGTVAAFEKCITLNNWSHGLYYYICGSCHVEMYRLAKFSPTPDSAEVEHHKAKASEFFDKVAPNTGRKKFMARQLPFDVFVLRKLAKWQARAEAWGCAFIDAVGVSPIEEMIFFWNGHKRMRAEHFEASLQRLAWSESSANENWGREELDEHAVLAVLRAAVWRNMGKTVEARELLEKEILAHDKSLFKGGTKDSWTAPVARYEMAACFWREADVEGRPDGDMEKLGVVKGWLEEVSRWESYDLDARIGMKVTTAKSTLRRYGVEC